MEKVVFIFFLVQILLKIRLFSKTFSGFPSQFTSYCINITIWSPLKRYLSIKFSSDQTRNYSNKHHLTPYGYFTVIFRVS